VKLCNLLHREMLMCMCRYRVHAFTDLAALDWAIYLALSTVAFNDFIIASSLCYFLTTSRTGFSRSRVVFSSIRIRLTYSIQHGLIIDKDYDLYN